MSDVLGGNVYRVEPVGEPSKKPNGLPKLGPFLMSINHVNYQTYPENTEIGDRWKGEVVNIPSSTRVATTIELKGYLVESPCTRRNLSDAKRLAYAVLDGETDAALALADEVIERHLRPSTFVPRDALRDLVRELEDRNHELERELIASRRANRITEEIW